MKTCIGVINTIFKRMLLPRRGKKKAIKEKKALAAYLTFDKQNRVRKNTIAKIWMVRRQELLRRAGPTTLDMTGTTSMEAEQRNLAPMAASGPNKGTKAPDGKRPGIFEIAAPP